MRLSQLTEGLGTSRAGTDPDIVGLTENSRRIRPGMLFVAVRGTVLDGHAFLADAVSRGAAAVVVERADAAPPGIPTVRVADARAALAVLAARFYGTGQLPLALIGFTGTFGKTSTSEILRALLDAGGARAAVLGSLGARYRSFHDPGTGLTTPAPVELHGSLRALHDAGADNVIMEVTSHALRLGRVSGLRFSGGLLAAIMPGEHTDFHRTYEDYVEAKRLFLRHLAPGAPLAFDADNPPARRLGAETEGASFGFSLDGHAADLEFSDVHVDAAGASFEIRGRLLPDPQRTRLHSSLLGGGHLRNVALALTYALAGGLPIAAARDVLRTLRPLRRRMERYDVGGRTVLDDTAAHPDSLRAAFEVASLLPRGALIVVYAVRGSRGAEINRGNALALADLCAAHGVRSLVTTESADVVGPHDRVTAGEADVTRRAFAPTGCPVTWRETLEGAVRYALEASAPGDLIILLGAQGMNDGKRLLERVS